MMEIERYRIINVLIISQVNLCVEILTWKC
jgi:hypothetical protein